MKIGEYLDNEVYELEEDKEIWQKLQLAVNLNKAACYLREKRFQIAIESCQKALQLDTTNEKGLYRMGQAYLGLGNYQNAIKYFKKVIEINPENKEAIACLNSFNKDKNIK